MQVFRAGGNGGQHQNKTSTGVRLIHEPSGARGEARDTRSQDQNKRLAFRRLGESRKFKQWVADQFPKEPVQPQPNRRYTYKLKGREQPSLEKRTLQEREI